MNVQGGRKTAVFAVFYLFLFWQSEPYQRNLSILVLAGILWYSLEAIQFDDFTPDLFACEIIGSIVISLTVMADIKFAVCFSVCLSDCLSVYLCLSICLSLCLSVHCVQDTSPKLLNGIY